MSAAGSVMVAVCFGWIGLIVGISFIEAPLKFRAPGVTLRIGLGIGRIVFRAVNAVEAVLAAVVLVALAVASPAATALVALSVAIAALVGQLAVLRPRITRRSNAILAGGDAPRSRVHHVFVAVEAVKLLALLVGGIAALAAA